WQCFYAPERKRLLQKKATLSLSIFFKLFYISDSRFVIGRKGNIQFFGYQRKDIISCRGYQQSTFFNYMSIFLLSGYSLNGIKCFFIDGANQLILLLLKLLLNPVFFGSQLLKHFLQFSSFYFFHSIGISSRVFIELFDSGS